MFEKIQKWHAQGLWTDPMVAQAVRKGAITQAQADTILLRPENGAESEKKDAV